MRSWKNHKVERDEIRAIARRIVQADAAVRARYAPSVATGLICEAMRNPALAATPEVARAAAAQEALHALHHKLVWEEGLDYDFVRLEWATILDPSPAERARCRRLAGYRD